MGDNNQFIIEYFIRKDGSRYSFDKAQFEVFNRLEGEINSYYENGALRSVFNFENGNIIVGRLYYEDGSIWQEYDSSKFTRVVYSKEGEVLRKESYIDGCR